MTRLADALGQMPDVTVLTRSEPLATRQGSGRRIYLTVLVDDDNGVTAGNGGDHA